LKTSARFTTGCWTGCAEGGLLAKPHPRQYEFARLNLTYVITSKRKLKQLVDEGHVSGWDDPRMPTIVGLRRRGYTPESLQLFAERIGVTKSDSWIDYSTLEGCLRDRPGPESPARHGRAGPGEAGHHQLGRTAWRRQAGRLQRPRAPAPPRAGPRSFKFGRELWIEKTDYEEVPPKGYNRLYPGNKVRLKYGHVIECTGAKRDDAGQLLEVHATLVPDTKSGTPGSDAIKVKGVITWVAAADALPAEVRLYDRLFAVPQPDTGDKDFLEELNPDSLKVVTAYVEPSLASAKPDEKFQFERHGYFVADRTDHAPHLIGGEGKPVFNRVAGMKDSWGK
jgi:glutaminyl-tRNA synthetase